MKGKGDCEDSTLTFVDGKSNRDKKVGGDTGSGGGGRDGRVFSVCFLRQSPGYLNGRI